MKTEKGRLTHARVYFATDNTGKVRDYRPLFAQYGLHLVQAGADVSEGSTSMMENAFKKARACAERYPEAYICACDGGVSIPFLGDSWNPVLTKRGGGSASWEGVTGYERARELLAMMRNAHGEDRRVVWQEAFVFMRGERVLFSFCEAGGAGYLAEEIPPSFREDGYWLGHLWHVPEYGKVYMELSAEEKKRSSRIQQRLERELGILFPKDARLIG